MSFGSFALLPNITGEIVASKSNKGITRQTGVFQSTSATYESISGHTGAGFNSKLTLVFKAINSNQIYHTDSTVQPLALVLNYVIKY